MSSYGWTSAAFDDCDRVLLVFISILWLSFGEVQEKEVVTLITSVTEQLIFLFFPVCEQNVGDV
jgi:hypothetical protein